jgi:hypothetical protein
MVRPQPLYKILAAIYNTPVKFEERPAKYKYGVKNYGDVVGTINAADGDPWDVFAPGLRDALPVGRRYRVTEVLGVYVLCNGNHKIAVRVATRCPYDEDKGRKEIRRYCARYTEGTGVEGTWVPQVKSTGH